MSTGCKSSLVNRVTSCLFSFVVEFANWFTFEASLKLALMCFKKINKKKQNNSTKNTKSSLFVPLLSVPVLHFVPTPYRECHQAQQRLLWIRPAELGKQPKM